MKPGRDLERLRCFRCLGDLDPEGGCVMPSKTRTQGRFYHRECCPDHGSPLSLGERAVNVLVPALVLASMFVFGLLVAGLIVKVG